MLESLVLATCAICLRCDNVASEAPEGWVKRRRKVGGEDSKSGRDENVGSERV